MSTEETLARIERLSYDRARLSSLLAEALAHVKRSPGGEDLAVRIANELARQLATKG